MLAHTSVPQFHLQYPALTRPPLSLQFRAVCPGDVALMLAIDDRPMRTAKPREQERDYFGHHIARRYIGTDTVYLENSTSP